MENIIKQHNKDLNTIISKGIEALILINKLLLALRDELVISQEWKLGVLHPLLVQIYCITENNKAIIEILPKHYSVICLSIFRTQMEYCFNTLFLTCDKDSFENKSMDYVWFNLQRKQKQLLGLSKGTKENKELLNRIKNDKSYDSLKEELSIRWDDISAIWKGFIAKDWSSLPHYKEAEFRYDNATNTRNWYSISNNSIRTFEQLSKTLNQEMAYEFIYRENSEYTHANSFFGLYGVDSNRREYIGDMPEKKIEIMIRTISMTTSWCISISNNIAIIANSNTFQKWLPKHEKLFYELSQLEKIIDP
jgi:hypothetical protein